MRNPNVMNIFVKIFTLAACLTLFSCAHKKESAPEPTCEQDLSGLRVATVNGSVYALKLSDRKDIDLQLYTFEADALQALLTGKVDVMAFDEIFLNRDHRAEFGVKIAFLGEEDYPTALMFRKDDFPLANALNQVQEKMAQDGTLDSLKTFWLEENYLDTEEFSHIPVEPEGTPIKVACLTNMAPISFMVDGEWYGIETDLCRELGRYLHRPVEFHLYDITSAIMALRNGLADVMTGCLFITEERQEEYLFSDPYHAYGEAYFIKDNGAQKAGGTFWNRARKSVEKNLIKEKRWKYITSGLWTTIVITILAILLGSVLGIGLCAMTRSRRRWLRWVADVYNWFMAGIPMLVLLLILFYVIFAGSGLNPVAVAVIAFALNFASGASDVYGTSLDAIPYGQTEAGLALGFTRLQTFMHIVLPQAVKRGLPLYQGQCVSLLKGTSIVGYIAIQDLTRAGDIIRSRTFDAIVPLLLVTVIYFLLAWLLGALIKCATPKTKVL